MGTAILADDRQGKDGATTPLVGLWVYDSARRVLSVDERCRALFALDGAGDIVTAPSATEGQRKRPRSSRFV